MPLGVKGRRSYPLLRLGSYKPMVFRPWVVDEEVSVVDLCNYALENGYRVYGGTTNQFFYDVAANFGAEGLPDPVQCYGDSVDALYDAVKK